MLWFVIFGVLFVLGITALVLYSKSDYCAPEGSLEKWAYRNDEFLGIFGCTFLVVNGLILFCMFFSVCGINAEFNKTINEYNSTKQLVESYQRGDYGNAPALTEKVIELNDKIAKHKAKYNSPWFNVWYSEEVGNLEPITFKKY